MTTTWGADTDLDPLELDDLNAVETLADLPHVDTEAFGYGAATFRHTSDPVQVASPRPRHSSAPGLGGKVVIKKRDDASTWATRGECRRLAGLARSAGDDVEVKRITDLFFPTRMSPAGDIAKAQAICNVCPVKVECLAHFLLNWERGGGIYGGQTDKGRRKLRRDAIHDKTYTADLLGDWLRKRI